MTPSRLFFSPTQQLDALRGCCFSLPEPFLVPLRITWWVIKSPVLPASAYATALPSSSNCPQQAQEQGWQQSLLWFLLWCPGETTWSDVW